MQTKKASIKKMFTANGGPGPKAGESPHDTAIFFGFSTSAFGSSTVSTPSRHSA